MRCTVPGGGRDTRSRSACGSTRRSLIPRPSGPGGEPVTELEGGVAHRRGRQDRPEPDEQDHRRGDEADDEGEERTRPGAGDVELGQVAERVDAGEDEEWREGRRVEEELRA